VGRFRARESRRVFDAIVNVGTLAGSRDSFVARAQDLPALDPGLRIDVVCALLDDNDPRAAAVWLTRPGAPSPHDLDLQWMAAATSAFGIHGRELAGFYAITRSGWLDLRTGQCRVWRRLRL
jgi:hypothetical protein